jgi:hypothetical protein
MRELEVRSARRGQSPGDSSGPEVPGQSYHAARSHALPRCLSRWPLEIECDPTTTGALDRELKREHE